MLFLLMLSAGAPGCAKPEAESTVSCPKLSGTPWVPALLGASASNHDQAVSLSQQEVTASGPIIGLLQPAPASVEVSIPIDMTQDLGPSGSLTLTAQVTEVPSILSAVPVSPMLVSLHDGTHELINLARAGTGGDCAQNGYYSSCDADGCIPNPACVINWPSSYQNRDLWEQHQESPSVSVFPTCNWDSGSGQSSSDPACAFNSVPFFTPSTTKLRSGTTYTAKYLLMANTDANLVGKTGTFTVTIAKKTNPHTTLSGALDLNIILVGATNIQHSRTTKGKQNLDTFLSNISNFYKQSPMNLNLGTVRAIEWGCDHDGDAYANPETSALPSLFKGGSLLSASSGGTNSVNLFLVSSLLQESGSDTNLTLLGRSGAIGGPTINGTEQSGVVISTFDQLSVYNSSCPSSTSTCSLAQQSKAFFRLSQTASHEIGHYLGLNHTSESTGTFHDGIKDTPICTALDNTLSPGYITITSCLVDDLNTFGGSTCGAECSSYDTVFGVFCPNALACPFNNMMWWTSKNFHTGTGSSDGNSFSNDQSEVVNYHPLVW